MLMIESGSEINEAKQLFPGYQEITDLFLFLVEPISQLFTDCYSIMINVYFISDNGTLMNRHRNMRDDVTESSVLYIISDPLSKIKLLSFK